MTCIKSQAPVIFMVMSMTVNAQKLASLEVQFSGSPSGLHIPVHTELDDITHLSDIMLSLVQIQGQKRIPVPFQVVNGPQRRLIWMVNDKDKNLHFELTKTSSSKSAAAVRAEKKDGALTITSGNRNLLRYQYETMLPPQGVNEVFKRSGFIHPLWSPKGQILTRIQPPDHYHHYGLWNPWTHVLFRGDTIDFWNLNGRTGTVRFSDFLSVVNGNVFSEFSAVHDHIALKDGKETVAIKELQTVRVYATEPDASSYIVDITSQMTCPNEPVRLLEYRYGGLGWRATEQWTKDNSRVLTSEGKTRKDADGSTARWAKIEGIVDGANAGIVMMSYPGNYNHPEPLRIWPENSNKNRGDMFANFSPTKNMDWQLEPGRTYVLRYRLIVFNGEMSEENAETGWRHYATYPVVKVRKN